MSNKKEQYGSEFKAKVALEALNRNKKNLDPLSKRYDVPVSLILVWTAQLEQNAAGIYQTTQEPAVEEVVQERVDLEISNTEISNSLKQGVMSDHLNYKRLIAWSVIGLILVAVFTQMLIEIFQINTSRHPELVLGEEAYYEVKHKKSEARQELSSYGVIDDSLGIYRVPIDKVIEQMAQEAKPESTADDLLEKIDPTPVE